MEDGVFWHLRPDLIEMLVDAIPLLTRGKDACLNIFHNAGVPRDLTKDIAEALRTRPQEVRKHVMTRTILTRINDAGDDPDAIKCRREVVRRVVEWENLNTCYPDNVLKAKGAVSQWRTVGQLFTMMERSNGRIELRDFGQGDGTYRVGKM